MSQVTTAQPTSPTRPTGRIVARWMVSFIGFPLGGLVALIVTEPVNSAGTAVAGGLITGVELADGSESVHERGELDVRRSVALSDEPGGRGLLVGDRPRHTPRREPVPVERRVKVRRVHT